MKQQGVALVLVLWIVSLLTIMAASFTLTIRRETSIIGFARDSAQARAIAAAGVASAKKMLLNTDEKLRWHADGSLYQLTFSNAKIRLRIFDEAGKIDLNHVQETLLNQLMQQAPITEEQIITVTDSILDWRDKDSLVRLHGAEEMTYQSLGYQPRNDHFVSMEELQMVQGMTPELFQWMKLYFTVYGQKQTNPQLASAEVLHLLYPDQSEAIDSYLFERLSAAKQGLPRVTFPLSQQGTEAKPDSNYITIVAESMMSEQVSAGLHVLLEKQSQSSDRSLQILQWQINNTIQSSLFAEEYSDRLVKDYQEPDSYE